MSLALVAIFLIIASSSLMFLLWPWLESFTEQELRPQEAGGILPYQQLVQEREILMENLKDMELDYQMQKLSEEDHDELKDSLMRKLVTKEQEIEEIENSSELFFKINKDLEGLRIENA